jgi:transposase
MEATGDYWKPVFYRLEAEGFELVLADARQIKNMPGRPKRDPSDSRWVAQCFERGAIRGCFVATPEFRVIREHTRYRPRITRGMRAGRTLLHAVQSSEDCNFRHNARLQ